MIKNDNNIFYLKLQDYYLSDWINYLIIPYDDHWDEDSFSLVEKITKLLYDCFVLLQFNNQEKGLQVLEKISLLIPECSRYNFQFDYVLVKTKFLISTYQFAEALTNLESVRDLFSSYQDHSSTHYMIRQAIFLRLLVDVYQELNQLDKAIETCNTGLELSIKNHFDHKTFEFYYYFARIYKFTGDFTKATNSANNALQLSMKLADIQKQISSYLLLGTIESLNRNLKQSIEYHRTSVLLAHQSNSQHLYKCLNNLAMDLWLTGYLNDALPLLLESEGIVATINDERELSRTYNNLALLFVTKGEYEQAEKYLLQSLELKEHTHYNYFVANTYMNLGELSFEKGDLQSAEQYYKKCLEYSTNLNDMTLQVQALCCIILTYCSEEDLDKCRDYHSTLTTLMESSSSEINKLRYDITTAVISASSNNFDAIIHAKNKFEKIIEENQLDFDITITSYFYYCKTIFKLNTLFGTSLSWDKMNAYLTTVQAKAKELHIYSKFFICKILSSKFQLLNNNLNMAEKLLYEVIADTKIRGFDLVRKMAYDSMESLNIIKFANDNVLIVKPKPSHTTTNMIEEDIIHFISNLA